MLRTASLLLLALLVVVSSAAAEKALVRVYFEDLDHVREVVGTFDDVAAWHGKRYADIVVPAERVGELKNLAPQHEILIPDVRAHMEQRGILGVGSAYHTQEETYADMDSVATAYPGICELQSIGLTHEGRDIWAMKISDNVETTEDEPKVLYLGAHHAREVISVEIPLYIMYWLVEGYGTDSLQTYLVDNREIWIVPLMNPDGREYVEHTGDWRKNRRDNGDGTYGVDLNRNWGYMWGYDDQGSSPNTNSETYRGPSAFSEPETQAVRDLMLNYDFDTAISYHSYSQLVLYPWGYTSELCDDAKMFHALAESMATFNGYAPGPASGLYPANGVSDDWMYGEQLIKDVAYTYTYEVGTEFYPPTSDIIPLCEENLEASILIAEYADNVFRILPPNPPVLADMPDDDDGDFTVSWTPDVSDTVNPSVQHELIERTGPSEVTDDVEAGDIYWDRSKFKLSTNRAYSGSQSFYGGRTNNRNATLTMAVGLDAEAGDTLVFRTWYDIETDWDYAYVEASTDGGATFYTIPGDITTTSNPNGNNLGHGITGSSGGWTLAHFPLGGFADSTVLLRFRYKTDGYVLEEGIYVDDIFPVQTFDSTIVLSSTITETYYDVSRPVGTYYYEVRAMDPEGQWSNLSQRESVTVTGAGVKGVDLPEASGGIPNPVYAGSELRFAVPAGVQDRIPVFDVRGRVVRDLPVSSGECVWDLADDSGRAVSPGIYFVAIDRKGERAVRKIVILE
jgi:hypothetical protein